MATCLTDYIGIKGCSTDAPPESGLYINSLAGISLESIDRIATEDQITYRGVWADAQDEAYVNFSIDFFNEVMKCFKVQPYCDYDSLICENKQKLVSAWKYALGAQIMLYRIYSARINYFTTVALEDAQALLGMYQAESEKALCKAVRLIDVRKCHLECGGNPEYVTWLP